MEQGLNRRDEPVKAKAGSNRIRYITWPMMLYILAYAMPIRNMNGIDTPVDAVLAASIIAIPSFVVGFLLVALVNIFRKRESRTWIPNFQTSRGLVFMALLVGVVALKSVWPDGMLPLLPGFAAMGLLAGKWRSALPTN